MCAGSGMEWQTAMRTSIVYLQLHHLRMVSDFPARVLIKEEGDAARQHVLRS